MNRSRSQAKALPPIPFALEFFPQLPFIPSQNRSFCTTVNAVIIFQRSFFWVCMSGAGVGKGGGDVSIFWAMFSPYLCVTRQFWSNFSKTFLGKCAYAVDYDDLIWLKHNFITKSLLVVRVGLDLQVGSCVYRMSKAMGCYLLPPMGCYKLK